MSEPEDGMLVRQARGGDSRAFEVLINRHYERMFAIAYKWTRDKADAEDVTQMACINMAKGIRSLRDEKTFTTWLYRVVVNAAKDFFRQNNKTQSLAEGHNPASEAASPEENLQTREKLEAIYALAENERDALLLVFGEGLSHAEAAEVLGCAESTVSWRIHEARKRLNEQQEKKG